MWSRDPPALLAVCLGDVVFNFAFWETESTTQIRVSQVQDKKVTLKSKVQLDVSQNPRYTGGVRCLRRRLQENSAYVQCSANE